MLTGDNLTKRTIVVEQFFVSKTRGCAIQYHDECLGCHMIFPIARPSFLCMHQEIVVVLHVVIRMPLPHHHD